MTKADENFSPKKWGTGSQPVKRLIALAGCAPRPAASADVKPLQELIAACYAEYDCVLDPDNLDADLFRPGEDMRRAGGDFFVLQNHESEILACIGFTIHGDIGELKRLYVAPSARKRGLGAAFTEFIHEKICECGCNRAVLWSDTRFLNAHRLYEKYGYRRTGNERDLHDINCTREFEFARELTG
ncbi:MAG: GNAT family N-acetyltransferase [Phycisphaerae bacterium]